MCWLATWKKDIIKMLFENRNCMIKDAIDTEVYRIQIKSNRLKFNGGLGCST